MEYNQYSENHPNVIFDECIDIELLYKVLKIKNIKLKDIALKLNINYSTLYRKIINESEFTHREIQMISTIIGIENAFNIFFPNWIA